MAADEPQIQAMSLGQFLDMVTGQAQSNADHQEALMAAVVYCLIHYVPTMSLEIDVEAYNRLMETEFSDMQLHRHLFRNDDGTVKMIKVEMVHRDVADEDLHEDDELPTVPPTEMPNTYAKGIN